MLLTRLHAPSCIHAQLRASTRGSFFGRNEHRAAGEGPGHSTAARCASRRSGSNPLARRARRVRRHRTPRFADGRPGVISAPGARELGNHERRTAIPDRQAQGAVGSRSVRRVTTRSTTVNHERAPPAAGLPVTRSQAARVCLRSCPDGHRAAFTGGTRRSTAALSLPRARLTRLGVPRSPLQSTRPVMPGLQARGEAHRDGRYADNFGRTRRDAARLESRPRVCRLLPTIASGGPVFSRAFSPAHRRRRQKV